MGVGGVGVGGVGPQQVGMGGVAGVGVGVGVGVQHAQGGWFKQGVPGPGPGVGPGPGQGGLMGMRAPYAAGARLGARYFPGGVVGSPPATPAPRPPTPSELLLLRQSSSQPAPHPPPDDQLPPMTPQDQLTKFVEQL